MIYMTIRQVQTGRQTSLGNTKGKEIQYGIAPRKRYIGFVLFLEPDTGMHCM